MFSQLLSGLAHEEFARCSIPYKTERRTHAISPYEHFAAMVFAQLTYREGLRDVEACLGVRRKLLYHSGIRGRITRTNLAYANEHRSWEMFAAITNLLMRKAQRLYSTAQPPLDLDGELFALDASLIDLSVKLFPWARKQPTEAAVKLNLLLKLTGDVDIPSFSSITEGTTHDVLALDQIPVAPRTYWVMDRGYLDFRRLKRIDDAAAWFVTRAKRNISWYVVACRKVDRTTGLRCDQTICLNSKIGKKSYPKHLRRVRYVDRDTGKSLVFLTNNFSIEAITVAEIYKNRWRIEIFFKWLKQNLRLRSFFSHHPNGVRIQILAALCSYLLIAITKAEKCLPGSMHRLLQIVSITIFEKVPLEELLSDFNTRTEQVDTQMLLAINET